MHTYAMMTDVAEIEEKLVPVLKRNGSEIPPRGCFIAAVEFDEDGQVVAYQMLQNAVFFEGLWSQSSSAHLLKLWHMAEKYAKESLNVQRIMTMTRSDQMGSKIGRVARALGMEKMDLVVYRRKV